ncbi:MAG: T9SS type A sorting domain-containing protein [Bacteroidetes bacterium]|nr:T9SS type A sorting domain-containing protein [Bacteroidota bacterium]
MRKFLTSVFLSFVILLLSVFTPVKTNATTYIIQVVDSFFNPNSQNAAVGDTILFQYVGPTRSHTATCDPGIDPTTSLPVGAATFDAPLNSGSLSFTYVLTVEGTYQYNCQFHAGSGMTGILNVAAGGPPTYVWNRTDSADFQVASNWTPDRTTPGTTDVLVFNNGAANTIAYNIPTQTIAGFQVTSNTTLKCYDAFAGASTITITGGTNPNLQVEAGSNLTFASSGANTNTIVMNLAMGTTGLIGGTFTFTSTLTGTGHRLQAVDAGAVVFQNGSIFNYGPFAGGNAYGAGSGASGLNSVVFQNGSKFVFRSIANGANPFGASAPNTVCVFQTGSTYEHQSNLSPVASGRTYANFVMNLAGGTASVTGASALTLDNLTVTDGTFNCNMTGRINIKGNISVAAGKTLNFTPASNPVDSLVFNGTSQQSISGAGTINITNTLTIQTKVLLNNSAGLVLNKNITFPGSLNLLSGNITTGSNTLTLGTSILNLGTLTRTSGTIIGNFSRWFAPSTVSNVLFPVGTATNYRPVLFTLTSNPFSGGTVTVGHTDGTDGSDLAAPFSDGGYSIERRSNMFWTVTPSFSDGVYTVSADGNGQTGITDINNLRLIYSPDGTTFSAPGTHVAGSGGSVASRSGLAGSVAGNFFLGGNNSNNPLPVEMDNFVASTIKNEVILDWATGHELNNSGFEVQRASLIPNQNSTDFASTINYTTVGYVQSRGNSNLEQTYKFNDRNLQAGRYAYRLKQIDVNGNYTYFILNNEVFVNLPAKFFISQNYPNPFNPTTNINYEIPFDGMVKILVYDNTGREIKTLVNGNVNAGYHKVEFNASGLPSGVYFYRVNASSGSQNFDKVFKMMLIK